MGEAAVEGAGSTTRPRRWRLGSLGDAGSRLRERFSYPPFREKAAPFAVLVVLMAGYAMYYGMWSVRKYHAYQAPAFDMAIFDQGVWLLSRFKEPFVTILGLNLFGDHVCFAMVAFVPLYWLFPGPETLLVVQAMALAMGAIPVYLLGVRVLWNRWFALIVALAYLMTPALGWLNLENFHPDSLEVPLALFALYFATVGRWRWYMAMVISLMLVKEDTVLLLVPMGVYVALTYNRRIGLLTAGLAIGWFVITFFGIQPALSGASPGSLDAFRIPFGGFAGLLKTMILRPWEVIAYMLTAEKIMYVFQLLTPVLFLPLLSWRVLVALPVLFFNLISTFWYQSNLQYHYHSMIIPVLAVAALFGLEKFRRLRTRQALTVVMLLATMVSLFLWGPAQGSRAASYYPDSRHPECIAADEALTHIPDEAVVSAVDKFASHMANRERVYVFPNPYSASYWGDDSLKGQRLPGAEDVEYVMLMPALLSEEAARVYQSLTDEGFSAIYDREGIVLLHREPSGQRAPTVDVLTEHPARSKLRLSHDTTTP